MLYMVIMIRTLPQPNLIITLCTTATMHRHVPMKRRKVESDDEDEHGSDV